MTSRGTFRQIAGDIRHRIESGELPPGSVLPSEHAIARDYSVSRGTARAALAVLAEAELVETVPGQGRRVVGSPNTLLATTAWEKVAADLRQLLKSNPTPAARLPSEAELSARHSVSRNTVRRAYRQLVDEGLVVVRHGSGAFGVQGDREAAGPIDAGRS